MCASSRRTRIPASLANSGPAGKDLPARKKNRLGRGYSAVPSMSAKAASGEAERVFESGLFGDTLLDSPVGPAPKTERKLFTKEESLITKSISLIPEYWS